MMNISILSLLWWLHRCHNFLKLIELYILNGLILLYVNYKNKVDLLKEVDDYCLPMCLQFLDSIFVCFLPGLEISSQK